MMEQPDLDGQSADVREAYKSRDVQLSILAHKAKAGSVEAHTHESGKYVKNIIFGGLDGIITTFAVVAGVAGADLSAKLVLVLGVANLIADGISMGFGDYLSGKAELEYVKTERDREVWEFKNSPESEKEEMVEIYVQKGFSEEDARTVMDILVTNEEFFIDHMLVQELGLMPPDPEDNPAKDGAVMFLAFLAFGFVPLLAYTIDANDEDKNVPFIVACVLTAVTLFVLGLVKGRLAGRPLISSGFGVLLNGGLAAVAAYMIGWGIGAATGIEGSC